MNKIERILLGAVLLGVILLLVRPSSTSFGGTTHFSGPVASTNGFMVSSTQVISPNGQFTFGLNTTNTVVVSSSVTIGSGATSIETMECATASKAIGTLIAGATTTVEFSIPSVSTSANQVYSWGAATSTLNKVGPVIAGSLQPSSTAGVLSLNILNASGTSFVSPGLTSFSACAVTF